MKLTVKCEKCGSDAKLKSKVPFGKKYLQVYQCGHSVFTDRSVNAETVPDVSSYEILVNDIEISRFEDDGGQSQIVKFIDPSFYSLDGEKCAYEFQQTGVEFVEKTHFKALIADAMGLGKTIQALIALKRNRKALMPVIIIVKGSTVLQWCGQIKTWLDDSPLGVMPIMNRDCIIPGFEIYVISMDFIGRAGVLERLSKLKPKSIVVDEIQNFKNGSSKRTKALVEFILECKIEGRLFLSGTPIKNRANEYYVPLNLLDPVTFYSPIGFSRNWLIPNEKSVYTRIDPMRLEEFHALTSRYIIRREKHDVLKNLPKLTRDYQLVEIEDPIIKNAYNNELDLFANFKRTAGRMNSTVLLGWLAKMRAITGQAKIPWAVEYADEFMNNTSDPLLVGIHHHSVRDVLHLTFKSKGYDPVKFSGEDDTYQKERAKQNFMAGKNRIMIMNMLAGGVGVDGLQSVCNTALVLERQWNSADEEQFESRIDRDGQKLPTTFVYPIATGTIDEFFHDMVNRKIKDVAETMGDKHVRDYDIESDEDFLRELTEKTLAHRL